MRLLFLFAAASAVAGLTVISLIFNYKFGAQYGPLFGALSIAFDLVKICLPVIVVVAATARGHSRLARGAVIVVAAAFWLPISLYSLNSALSSAMLSRSDAVGGREAIVEKRKALDQERERLLAKNPWTARLESWKAQPSTAIAAQLEASKSSRFWKGSAQCANPSGPKAAAYCESHALMASAYEIAKQVERDGARLSEIEAERAAIPPLTEADPAITAAYLAPYVWGRLLAVLLELIPSFLPAILLPAYRLSQSAIPEAVSKATPWEVAGISRATYFRRKKKEALSVRVSSPVLVAGKGLRLVREPEETG